MSIDTHTTLAAAVDAWLATLDGTRPLLLDLFCCEGGAAVGYHRAGWDVFGIDSDRARGRHYPFGFWCGDAIEAVKAVGHLFDAGHASPPCQAYSITKHSHKVEHPDLVAPTRDALLASGLPYIMENVMGAPLWAPVKLCGSMFDLKAIDVDGTPLRLERHRLFESNASIWAPTGCWHDKSVQVGGVYGGGSQTRDHAKQVRRGGYTPSKRIMGELIGADWMTLHGLTQSIPPAYTHWLGEQLLEAL